MKIGKCVWPYLQDVNTGEISYVQRKLTLAWVDDREALTDGVAYAVTQP